MLRNEVARYTELSGNDGLHTPIGIIGAYLDGYEKGRADAQPKLDENTLSEQQESDKLGVKTGETCTDCISRQAAIDEIARWIGYIDEDMILRIQTGLKKVPSAQGNTPTDTPTDTPTVTYGLGRWIEKEDDGYHGGGYTECSICGQRYSWSGYFGADEFRYCPRCGHRMEVQE